MTHREKICEYIRMNVHKGVSIEPKEHVEAASLFLEKQLRIHSPEKIVKLGLGTGALLFDLAEAAKYLVVIEQDLALIQEFIKKNSDDPRLAKVYFISADFHSIPLDWYCADMIVCTDYLDFHNVAMVLDECKRISEFEGILVIAGAVLHDDDIDGVYDELFRKIMPLHNDFYIPGDLRTVLKLKHFKFLDNSVVRLPVDLDKYTTFGRELSLLIGSDSCEACDDYIKENSDAFSLFYELDGSRMREIYEISVYRSEKPEKKEYEEEVAEYTRRLGRGAEIPTEP